MKPGLTCLWQISGRNEIDFDRWMALDLEVHRHLVAAARPEDPAQDGAGRAVGTRSTLTRRVVFLAGRRVVFLAGRRGGACPARCRENATRAGGPRAAPTTREMTVDFRLGIDGEFPARDDSVGRAREDKRRINAGPRIRPAYRFPLPSSPPPSDALYMYLIECFGMSRFGPLLAVHLEAALVVPLDPAADLLAVVQA